MSEEVVWHVGGGSPRIAVVGAGAVGCYYGGKVAASGLDVHFLMRNDIDIVRSRGIRLLGKEEEVVVRYPQVHSDPYEIGECDIVLISLKTTANYALQEILPPLVGESTRLATLQNGLGNEELLQTLFPGDPVLGGLCFVCLNRIEPGVVRKYKFGRIALGRHGGPADAHDRAIAEIMRDAGINADFVGNLPLERWRKQVWNVPFNGLCIAAGGVSVDALLASRILLGEVRELMQDVIRIACAEGHAIEEDFIDELIDRTGKMDDYKPSSLIDYKEGKAVEVEAIWGETVRRAKQVNVDVPRIDLLYAMLRELCSNQGI